MFAASFFFVFVLALNVAALAHGSHARVLQKSVVEWDPIDYGYCAAEIIANFVLGTLITAPIATAVLRGPAQQPA